MISLIRKSKRTHYSEIVSKCSGDQKQLFRVANKLLHRSKKSPLPLHVSDQSLAVRFSHFFTSKISLIRDVLPPPAVCLSPASTLTTLRSASHDEISTFMLKSPAKSCDLDPILTSLLRQCSNSIVPAIAMIINHSLKSGVVPSAFKSAHVLALLKKPTLDQTNFKTTARFPTCRTSPGCPRFYSKTICWIVANLHIVRTTV